MALIVIYDSEFIKVKFVDSHTEDNQNVITEVKVYGTEDFIQTIPVEQFCSLAMLPYEGRLIPLEWCYLYENGKKDIAPDGTPTIAITKVAIVNKFNECSFKYSYELLRQVWLYVSEKEAKAKGWA